MQNRITTFSESNIIIEKDKYNKPWALEICPGLVLLPMIYLLYNKIKGAENVKRATTCIILYILLMLTITGCSTSTELNSDNKQHTEINNAEDQSEIEGEQNSDTEQQSDSEPTEPIIEIDTHGEINRQEGYNSILLNFIDEQSNKPLKMSLSVEEIVSTKTHKQYKSIEDAKKDKILLEYKDNSTEFIILLKEGYKLKAIMNPADRNSISNWLDYKANYPIELTAIQEGSNQLNMFDIKLDYSSDIVSTSVETTVFE